MDTTENLVGFTSWARRIPHRTVESLKDRMITKKLRFAMVVSATASLALAGSLTAVAAQPSNLAAVHTATAAGPVAKRTIYLGTYNSNHSHSYLPKVRAGSYVVEYTFSLGGAMNTWIDATQPHIVPLPSGRYLGQVGGGSEQTVDTTAFSLTAGTHRITVQSPELYGPVKVYLKRVNS